MSKFLAIGSVLVLCCLVISCDNTVQCEKHFFPNGYTGKVVIYFNQRNGQKKFDKDGCIVYLISDKGECFSALPYKQGAANPNSTYRFFEVVNENKSNPILAFYQNEYLKDTLKNKYKKYVFYQSSGYSDPNYTMIYYVDFGMNYQKHLYY